MTWMQRLAKELETSTDRAFAWLLAAVMKPWRDRSLAYDLFGNPFALKEYRAMVRMAEEMLRGLIRELARKIVVVEEEEPAPAPKKRFAIGKIPPLRPVRGDFYFRMRDRFSCPSPRVGEGGPQGRMRGVCSPLAQPALAPLTRWASPATLSHRGRGAKKVATEGASFPPEKREEPDLTLIGLQLLLRAKAVDHALRQAKRHAMRYAYAQARKALKAVRRPGRAPVPVRTRSSSRYPQTDPTAPAPRAAPPADAPPDRPES